MNKKNIKILIIVIVSVLVLTIFYNIATLPLHESLYKERIKPNVQQNEKEVKTLNIKTSLWVQDKKYDEELKEGSTVFDLMQKIQNKNSNYDSFNFKYKEHTGLGIFISEINGLKGGSDGYWIYSINGKEANIGVSNYKINNGDIISWKYEK